MKKFVGILITLFVIMTFPGYTQQVKTIPNNIKFIVSTQIKCDDENTKQWISSYIKRELRSLGDVIIFDEMNNNSTNLEAIDKLYKLELIAIELIKGNNKTGGIVISVVHAKYIPSLADPFFADTLSPEMRQAIANHLADRAAADKKVFLNLYRLLNSTLHTGNKTDLSNICKDIVTAFDITTLQVARERK